MRMAVLATVLLPALAPGAVSPTTQAFIIRGQQQSLHLYGARGGPVAIVASGDGGWVHLGPYVAEFLSRNGYFVVGFDSKAYLSSFTRNGTTLTTTDVPEDFAALLDYAATGASTRPVLIGVSEGAGLSVLAATQDVVKAKALGVLALGLPDKNELGWRFRDSLIYLTHKAPDEPGFSAAEVVARLAPVPLAQLHSTHDEYVPLEEARRVYDRAGAPKRLWVIDASDHRFSNQATEFSARLIEAMDWVAAVDH